MILGHVYSSVKDLLKSLIAFGSRLTTLLLLPSGSTDCSWGLQRCRLFCYRCWVSHPASRNENSHLLWPVGELSVPVLSRKSTSGKMSPRSVSLSLACTLYAIENAGCFAISLMFSVALRGLHGSPVDPILNYLQRIRFRVGDALCIPMIHDDQPLSTNKFDNELCTNP